jgi:hypothetical protein
MRVSPSSSFRRLSKPQKAPFGRLRAHETGSGRGVATRASPPFALMHCLDTGDRNAVTLG